MSTGTLKEQATDGNVPENVGPYFRVVRSEMLEFVPPNATAILDVGCADGTFGSLLKKQRHVEVWGIEPNQSAANSAAQKLDRVICDAFDRSLALPAGKFDCIIFNDVLEHMLDPASALSLARALLGSGGCVVASIPNIRHFPTVWKLVICGEWEYKEFGILDETHLRFFTRLSIIRLFQEAGFTIQRIDGINSFHSLGPDDPSLWRRYYLFSWLPIPGIKDMRYQQFAIVAKVG
jgi:2-polyprenyl-3-methyl-5-hydroxy-6-metoxy-1,4-benzoquinol methylase